MRLKSLVSSVLMVTILSFGPNASAASEQSVYEGVAYSKVDLSEVGSLSKIALIQGKEKLSVSFELNGKEYNIDAVSFGKDENGRKYTTTETADGVSFNLLESNGSVTGVISNTKISPINQTVEESFGFVISKSVSQAELEQTIEQAQIENSEILESSVQSIHTLPAKKSFSDSRLLASDLHVLASGTSIPFLLSSGMSEGWVFSTHTTQQYFRVSNLRYNIAYNWPSDGVSLWYDYMNSTQAYHSPAWPAAGQTSVSGQWDIDATKGKFVAQTSVTALVKNVPLGYTVYDTVDVGN